MNALDVLKFVSRLVFYDSKPQHEDFKDKNTNTELEVGATTTYGYIVCSMKIEGVEEEEGNYLW